MLRRQDELRPARYETARRSLTHIAQGLQISTGAIFVFSSPRKDYILSRRTRRYFGDLEKQALLTAIGVCRKACIQACSKAPINEPIYRTCTLVTERIDELAEVLTGDKTYFWLKGGSVSSSRDSANSSESLDKDRDVERGT